MLREWQQKNHPWLELTDVHKEITENIRVTGMPFYIGLRVRKSDQLINLLKYVPTKCLHLLHGLET